MTSDESSINADAVKDHLGERLAAGRTPGKAAAEILFVRDKQVSQGLMSTQSKDEYRQIVDDLAIRRRDNNKWEPPGGTLELEEAIPDGLRREVREETGLEIVIGPLTGVYKNMARGIVALVFRCDHEGGSPELTDEVTDFRWMPRAEVASNLDPAYACRLLDALDACPPSVRAHDGVQLL